MSIWLNKSKEENQIAVSILNQIAQAATQQPTKKPAAVALGRLGGPKGGKARSNKLSSKRKREIARKAAKTRWPKRKSYFSPAHFFPTKYHIFHSFFP